jgi:UDP-glucose 4-epimerase
MKVVVTGGAGFIGSNLCRTLIEAGHEVSAIDDLSTGAAANLADTGAELIEGSILDRQLLGTATAGAEAIVHLAARPSVQRSLDDPGASHEINATGTIYVLEAARRAGAHVVCASSSSVYGASAQLPKHEELATRPLSPYGASKLAAEAYTLAYAASFELSTLALRFFNVYGPAQAAGHAYAAVIPAFVDHALRGEPLPVYGDGRQTRDFTFVDSVTALIRDAVARRVCSDTPVNVAFGTRTSLLELIEALSTELGGPLAVEHRTARAGDIRDSQADSTRLRRLFPSVEAVGLATGLAATVGWFRRLPGYPGHPGTG